MLKEEWKPEWSHRPRLARTYHNTVKRRSIFNCLIYHGLYDSLLVRCHRVANKDRRLLFAAAMIALSVRNDCTLPFASIAPAVCNDCTLLFVMNTPCRLHPSHPCCTYVRILRANILFMFIAPTCYLHSSNLLSIKPNQPKNLVVVLPRHPHFICLSPFAPAASQALNF